jgi:hypothetical protein
LFSGLFGTRSLAAAMGLLCFFLKVQEGPVLFTAATVFVEPGTGPSACLSSYGVPAGMSIYMSPERAGIARAAEKPSSVYLQAEGAI